VSPRFVVGFSVVFVAIGVALIVQTTRAGGGIGYLLGVLFVLLGLGRIYLLHARRSRG
jgi:hypothetical protein